MSKNRTVFTPGENAGLPPSGDERAEDAGPLQNEDASIAPTKTTEPLSGTVEQQMAAMRAEMAEMARKQRELAEQNGALVRQINAQAPPSAAPVELPTLEEVMARVPHPDIPVLTKDGWYAPPVTTSNPVRQRG